MNENQKSVIAWLAGRDTGISSKSLAFEFLGQECSDLRFDCWPPIDPSDLGRCLRLLAKVPAVRGCVDSLGAKHQEWAKAAVVWDAIAESMLFEVGLDWSKGREAPRTYAMMKAAGL